MVIKYRLRGQALVSFIIPLLPSLSKIFFMPLKLLKISSLLTNSLLIIVSMLNSTHFVFMWRTYRRGPFWPGAIVWEIFIPCPLLLHPHLLLPLLLFFWCLAQSVGHSRDQVLSFLKNNNFIQCNNTKNLSVCHGCQFGKHCPLPFSVSLTKTYAPFDTIHTDLYTYPLNSHTCFRFFIYFFLMNILIIYGCFLSKINRMCFLLLCASMLMLSRGGFTMGSLGSGEPSDFWKKIARFFF